MGMGDCSHCWETPCVCDDGHGYRHLSIVELLRIMNGMAKVVEDKMKRGLDPNKREHGGEGREA
jgi:hypothetical protein